MTCAIILPLIISTYRDSIIHGHELYVREYTRGQTFHLEGAKAEYLEHFEGISGLTAYFEGDTIYIKLLSEAEAKDPEKLREYERLLVSIVYNLQDERLNLRNVANFGDDESNYMFANQLLIVCAAIMLITAIILRSAYKTHLTKSIAEMGCLRSLGATRSQVAFMYYIEFAALFALSCIAAVICASAIMRALFSSYLQTKNVQNLAWVVYHMSPLTVGAQLLGCFALLSLVVLSMARAVCKNPIVSSLRATISGDKLKHYKARLRGKPPALLARLFLRRTNGQLAGAQAITIPVLVVFVFVFNYVVLNISEVSTPPEHEISINVSSPQGGAQSVPADWFTPMQDIDGILALTPVYNMSPSKYLVEDDRMSGPSQFTLDGTVYATTSIRKYSDYAENGTALAKCEVAVNANHKYLKFSVGDQFVMRLSPVYSIIIGSSQSLEPMTLTVSKNMDLDWTDRMFEIFVSDELHAELTAGESVNRALIKLNDVNRHKEIEQKLRGMYADDKYTILNNYESFLFISESSVGLWIMLLCLFGIMLAFVLVILGVKLSGYIDAQAGCIRMLSALGASGKCLQSAYMRQACTMAVCGIALACAIGYGALFAFFAGSGYHLVVNIYVVLVQLGVMALVLCAHLCPVYAAFRTVYWKARLSA